jgi:hypothetical protein
MSDVTQKIKKCTLFFWLSQSLLSMPKSALGSALRFVLLNGFPISDVVD